MPHCFLVAYATAPLALMSHAAFMPPRPIAHRQAPAVGVATDSLLRPTDAPLLSGLGGKALAVEKEAIPTKAQVRAALPARVMTRDTKRSLFYAFCSVVQSAACLAVGSHIPLTLAALPLWIVYACVAGTVWTGMWVVAHECGHGAFSDNRRLQDAVGYFLHTVLLVPYYSWQRSHAVHHARTNHISEGETHVPVVVGGRPGLENTGGEAELAHARSYGKRAWGGLQLALHLLIGWPAYLLWGATGGPKYGASNHFVPRWPFASALWPGQWAHKVWLSDVGILGMVGVLVGLASKVGAASVLALYGAPMVVVNAWLVGYTWLQHTDVDVPHFTANEFSYMRGAMTTIDRPYGKLLDHLHHKIGSTHVAHHIDCTIPHYHAREATDAIAKNWPDLYLFDPTPIHKALWRISANCVAVKLRPETGRYTWVPFDHESELQYQGTAA